MVGGTEGGSEGGCEGGCEGASEGASEGGTGVSEEIFLCISSGVRPPEVGGELLLVLMLTMLVRPGMYCWIYFSLHGLHTAPPIGRTIESLFRIVLDMA